MLKLKVDKRVRDYELTVLTPGDFTSTELKKTLDAIEALVKKFGGTVKEVQDWGKQSLIYNIKKQGKKYNDAIYTHVLISLSVSKTQDLEKQLFLDHNIIRHLLVIASNEVPTKLADLKQKIKR